MDHYKTLGVTKTATPDEIKSAYRKLASKHHPDKGGNTGEFQKIQTAYDILGDVDKRQEYDNPRPQHQGMPGGFDFGSHPGFNDMFSQIFKQHANQRQPQQQVYRTTIWISLEQVCSGAEQILQLQTPTGTQTAKVAVPKGIQDGGQVRLENIIEGASLIAEFRTHPHLKYTRHGQDLVCNQQISVLDLIVGTSFEFQTISGKTLEVTIPPKTQPYNQMKIAGHGLPIPNSQAFGDQIILLKPFIPVTIDESITNAILQSKVK